MRVLFIYPTPAARFQIPRFQQGLASISAVLKHAGHQTDLLVLSQFDEEALRQKMFSSQPGLVALSLTSGFFALGAQIARWVAANHGLPVLLGGVHPTLCPEESISAEGVSAICRGEGEYPTLELCEALEANRDPTQIANLWVKRNGRIHRNPIRPLIEDLDSLPFPDREVFRFQELLRTFPEAEFMGSRGCPHPCAYCVNHALIELYRDKGRYVRYRQVDYLLAEVHQVVQTYSGIAIVGFHDDTFTLSLPWLREFADKYPRQCSLPFWCNATAQSINDETVGLLKRAGCYEVRIGVESGNDRIRKEVLRKNVPRDQIVKAFRLLKEAGIGTFAFNMVGLPFEMPETIEDTIRLNQLIRPKEVFCSIFYPYPGTALHDLCREKGWLTGAAVGSYFESEYALKQPTVTQRQVFYYHDIFADLVRWPQWERLIRLMASIPVTRRKTLWNAWRRVIAKCRQTRQIVVRLPVPWGVRNQEKRLANHG